jgi:hypothetical protein
MSTRIPQIRAGRRGRVSTSLESIAERWREAHPSQDCRWIYDPPSKPELSNLDSRAADGYRPVTRGELDPSTPPARRDEYVRIADVVFCTIPGEAKRSLEQERVDLAREQALSVDRKYHEEISQLGAGMSEKHRPKGLGRVVIEEREFEYDREQRTGEEG